MTDQKTFSICGWGNLAAGPPGSTPAGLDRGGQRRDRVSSGEDRDAGAVAYRETHAAGNRANPQGCPAPSFREGCLMGPKCADPCHAGRPQAALLWIHPGTSPPPEIDEVARLEADCSISE